MGCNQNPSRWETAIVLAYFHVRHPVFPCLRFRSRVSLQYNDLQGSTCTPVLDNGKTTLALLRQRRLPLPLFLVVVVTKANSTRLPAETPPTSLTFPTSFSSAPYRCPAISV